MDQSFLGRGFAFPFSFKYGQAQQADGDELVEQSIVQILATRKGERLMRPDYGCGINELVFAANNNATATEFEFMVREALDKFEPRIEVLTVKAVTDLSNRNQLNIHLEYKVKAINSSRNLVYPFYLQGNQA
ncbi:GPW/gp25 family protein [Pseudoalteromonas sp. S16_S37]|uniref:GPW/gp25 family protein n=1 Tax=Pseudoalteromonas sp. S16_S37 TaxID=2720228 RepID=UPI0016818458|nr:GPW/gp25 family protein [Pseudoalteromonas sp. S16_S37]MBD1580868.1 GPW/gp25 family protein [Pseudoalteromonas sp. S16_S37]